MTKAVTIHVSSCLKKKKNYNKMVTRAYLVQPETVSPPSVRDKEDALGSIVSNKDRTMWGDASHRALSAALHVHAATQHWAANRFSPPTVTQAKRGLLRWLACVFLSTSSAFLLLPPFFKAQVRKNVSVRKYFWYVPGPSWGDPFPTRWRSLKEASPDWSSSSSHTKISKTWTRVSKLCSK